MYREKRVLVTGSTGMLGNFVVRALLARGALVRGIVHRRHQTLKSPNLELVKGDLMDKEMCSNTFSDVDYLFHLAVDTTSITRNIAEPGNVLSRNLLIDNLVLNAARGSGIKGILYCSCVCAYPENLPILREDDAWNGEPERTNRHFGWAKRIGELQTQAFSSQYGIKAAIVRPANSYGPGDRSDHAIPMLIRRAISRESPFVIWGDGLAKRDLVFAQDAAEGMLLALEKYPTADLLNLGSGKAVTVREIATMILRLSGYDNAKVVYDETKPKGQPVRLMDITKAKEKIGFAPKTSIEEGLRVTIEAFRHEAQSTITP